MEQTASKSTDSSAETTRKAFGKYIQMHRKKHKYTQQELADRLGVTSKTVSCTERGETFPSYENIFRLAKLLDMSLDEFVFGYSRFQDKLCIPQINEMLCSLEGDDRRIVLETVKTMCLAMKGKSS